MHFVLAENNDSSWQVVFEFTFSTDERKNILDAALASNLPITMMETTSFKNQAKSGATWNGTPFFPYFPFFPFFPPYFPYFPFFPPFFPPYFPFFPPYFRG